MRIVLVGPTHPAKGGVAQHTTLAAHELAARGDDVTLCSWASQYPKFLYPGEVAVPGETPEIDLFPRTTRALRWWWPFGWFAAGRAHRRADAVVFVVVTPVQIPAFLGIMLGLGRKGSRPRTIALCHNVIPHEARSVDRLLISALLKRVDGVLTHTPEMAAEAREFTSAPVQSTAMPPHLPDAPTGTRVDGPARRHVLFFGFVRPYKGADLLVRALAQVPDVSATIAGEFWSDPDELRALASEVGVADRVDVRAGYVAASEIPKLFDAADALVLPYRSGTASQNVVRAHSYGVPVIATRVGSFASDIRDGVDGLLCAPDDPDALAASIGHLYELGVLDGLRNGIETPDLHAPWAAYLDVLHDLAGHR